MQGVNEPALKYETALLARSVKGTADRESYLPAQLTTNDDGELIAFPLKWGGSSDFVAFALTTALLIVPAGTRTIEANTLVRVLRLPQAPA
jgi:molybdopterin biosynthesis enzyme